MFKIHVSSVLFGDTIWSRCCIPSERGFYEKTRVPRIYHQQDTTHVLVSLLSKGHAAGSMVLHYGGY